MENNWKMSAFLFGILLSSPSWAANQILSIDFQGASEPNVIEIRASGPIQAEKQVMDQDKQVIVEIKDATITKERARKIDTSSFSGPISLISPYQVQGQENVVRIVVQLRQDVGMDLKTEGNLLTLTTSTNATGSETTSTAMEAPPVPVSAESVAPSDPSTSPAEPAATTEVETVKAPQFTGKPINLNLRDTDIHDAFRLIADASGFNILISDDVKGKVSLSLTDVPWDQALDILLKTYKLGAEKNNNVLRVTTLADLTNEKRAEAAAQMATKAATPKVTKVFNISYVPLMDLCNTISTILGTEPCRSGGASPATGAAGQAMIQVPPPRTTAFNPTQSADSAQFQIVDPPVIAADSHTNSLIVRDTPETIEKIKKLIQVIDTQIPQILIEAKIVDASEDFSSAIKGSLGIGRSGTRYPTKMFASASGGNPLDDLIGSNGYLTSTGIMNASGNGIVGGAGTTLSFLPGFKLNALLALGESEQKVRIVSTPRTVVTNGNAADLLDTTPYFNGTQTNTTNNVTSSSTSTVDAKVHLNVTPTITNEGSVNLTLLVERGNAKAIGTDTSNNTIYGSATRALKTQVLVENGSTLVIGGLFIVENIEAESGVPYLRKIPILGSLFGGSSKLETRRELFIFVTPKILNPKEAGLAG